MNRAARCQAQGKHVCAGSSSPSAPRSEHTELGAGQQRRGGGGNVVQTAAGNAIGIALVQLLAGGVKQRQTQASRSGEVSA